jgi:hypothetical protein
MTNAIEKQKKILRLIFQPCQVSMCERIICLGIRKRMYSKTSLKWTQSGPKKSVHYKEVFIIERCISSKNRFFGLFKSVHYEEVFTMERCSLTEVLLYIYIQMHDLNDNFFSIDVRKRNNGTFFLNWPRPLLNTEMNGIFEFRQ